MNSVIITGTGRYEPTIIVKNSDFLKSKFFNPKGVPLTKDIKEIIETFQKITGINERKYANPFLLNSDIATIAAENALESAKISGNKLDKIIVAHNFGDIKTDSTQNDMVPSLASRVKQKLGIDNPAVIAEDLIFGCPGWLQGVINSYKEIRSLYGSKVLVIGSETLSRISDPHDQDSMIYSDGAGAAVLETINTKEKFGVLSNLTHSYSLEHANLLRKGSSYNPKINQDHQFIKMDGHEVYLFAIDKVPQIIKQNLEATGISPADIKKVIIHQANEKLDNVIIRNLKSLYRKDKQYTGVEFNGNLMPMIIGNYGNSSVATIPTLFDLMTKGELPGHDNLKKGDIVLFASVGAGMNINCMPYKLHQDLKDYRR